MECPCPCEKCGDVFDLHDGFPSEKWFPNIVICESCHEKEEAEIETDEEVEQLREDLSEAKYTIETATKRLIELGEPVEKHQTPNEIKGVCGEHKMPYYENRACDLCEAEKG